MADLSPEKIVEPISDEEPCGPDMEFEMDFGNLMAEVEGHLPDRYFSFDPSGVNFSDYFERIDGLLDKTRDVRLLAVLAQLRALNGDVDGVIEVLEAVHALLKGQWADVHPQYADYAMDREATLATLDNPPTMVLPMQHATLFRARRAGAITFRKWQLANGDVSPREDEERMDAGTIMNEIGDADADEMAAIVAKMERGRDALNGIRSVWMTEGDVETAPSYERLPEFFEGVIELFSRGTGAEAEAGPDPEGDDDAVVVGAGGLASVTVNLPTGDVATREAASDALFAAERYYAVQEPSSPVALLLREARAAANKSFAELVGEMLPSSASSAFFAFGKEPWFEVPLNDINHRNPAPSYDEDDNSGGSWESAGLDDEPTDNDEPQEAADDDGGWSSNTYGEGNDEASESAEDPPAEEAAADDGWSSNSYGEDSGEEAPQEPEPAVEEVAVESADSPPAEAQEAASQPSSAPPKFVANSRPEALALIEKALAYYRAAEPSSPVVLILEKALSLSTKNFIGLLREVLPDGHLKVKGSPAGDDNGGGWS